MWALSVQKNITIGCDKRRQIVKNVAYRKQAWRKIMILGELVNCLLSSVAKYVIKHKSTCLFIDSLPLEIIT